ncbi:MAG: ABC transporter substrate-binding protein [Acidobacteriia bacterium]|nr:ABC transporter substrate-binding protein [Terriglobia bacterium]
MGRRLSITGVLVAVAATASAEVPATHVRLVLPWRHQAQFAGYYAALKHGLYAQDGLDVTIVGGGPGRDAVELVRGGQADVAVLPLSAALLAREHGGPVVNVAQVVNRSNLMLVAWRNRGIRRLKDLEGRRVSMWQEELSAPFLDFFGEEGIKPIFVPQYFSVELFLRRGVDACAAMEYNEYHGILQAGVDPSQLTVARLRDAGFGIPEDGLYCLESVARGNPYVVARFAAASLAGWRWVADHQDEALDLTMEYLRHDHVPGNRSHMRWMLTTLLPSIFPSAGDQWTFGRLRHEDYDRTLARLTDHGVVHLNLPFEVFCWSTETHAP